MGGKGKGEGGGGCGVAKTTYQSPLPNLAKWEPHALGATFYMDHFSMVGGRGVKTTYQSPLPNLAKLEPRALCTTFYMNHFSMVSNLYTLFLKKAQKIK